jgi:6-phosphogluconolactonase
MVQAQTLTDTSYNLLIGTYTKAGKSDGIYVYEFNSETGKSTYRAEAAGIKNPSFLTVSEDRKHVYSVNEIGAGNGGVSAFSFDAGTGKLDYINSIGSGGNGPCYISVDKTKKYVFVGNYSGGSLAAVPIKPDGSLGASIQSIRHEGKSIAPEQQGPHVHASVLSGDNNFLYVPDLGTDKIHVYTVDVSKPNPLEPSAPPYVQVKRGSGPRHFTFHPNNKFAYSIQELMGIVTFFEYDNGQLKTMQSVDLVSINSNGPADAADIHISPDGKFLYGSLRGNINELVIYAINEKGMLTFVGRQSTLGKVPRNFAIDPTGNFLLVGNSGNDEIVVFKRNKATGLLTPTGETIQVGSPVCLKFVPVK